MNMGNSMSSNPGPGVDAQGRSMPDPTENVKSLNEASIKSLKELAALRAKYEQRLEMQRERFNDRLTRQRIRFEKELREADKELRKAESERLNSIRAVDIAAVQRSTQEASERANTLATQVATAADVVRTTLAAGLDPIRNDIADLRRSQSEALGQKTQVVDQRGSNTLIIGIITVAIAFVVALMLAITIYLSQQSRNEVPPDAYSNEVQLEHDLYLEKI